jgi:hypothetical protein
MPCKPRNILGGDGSCATSSGRDWLRSRRFLRGRVAGVCGVLACGLAAACSEDQSGGQPARLDARSTAGRARETVVWSEPIEVADGPADRGPWQMNDSEFDYVDDPSVALDGGRTVVVWADNTEQDVFLQVYSRTGTAEFAAPVNVSRSPDTFSWLPRVAISADDANEIVVVWQEIIFSGGSHGGEILFARSSDGGASFAAAVNLSGSPSGDGKGRSAPDRWHNGSLDLAVGMHGEIHVAWSEYEGALWHRRSSDGGQSFDARVRIAGSSSAPARGPSLAVDASATVHVAWTVGEDPAADVLVASSTDRGVTFGAPAVVAITTGHADAPKVAVDENGTVHVVYAEAASESDGRYQIRYTRRVAGDPSFDDPRTISPSEIDGVDHVGFPSLSADGGGGLYVVWERFPTHDPRPRGVEFAYSGDGGRSFRSHGLVPVTGDAEFAVNGGLQGLLMRKLAVASDGTIAIVNSSFREEHLSRIRLIHGHVETTNRRREPPRTQTGHNPGDQPHHPGLWHRGPTS